MSAPDEKTILDDISRLLAERLGRAYSGTINRDTRFFADLGLASIDAVVLGEALQEYYDEPLPFGALMADLGQRTDRDLAMGELVDFLKANL